MDWRRELAGLGAKAERGALDAEECWRQATLTEEVEGTAAALPLYRSLLQAHPKHAGANFAVGRIMLDGGEAQGLDLLESAMKLDPDSIILACDHAYQHLIETDRKAEAKSYEDRARQRYELEQHARAERSVLTPADTLLPHGLKPAVLATLVAQLCGVPALHRAYLTRKKLEYVTEHPLYVLAIETRQQVRSSTDADEIAEVLALNLDFPEDYLVVPLTSRAHRNQAEIRRKYGALIYEHPGSDSTPAEEGPWRMHVTAGMEAYQRGDHAEAEKQFEVALRKAEHFGPQDIRLAQSLDNLAGLYHTRGKYAEAEPLCKRALEIREKTLGPQHPDVAESLNKLVVLYHAQGRYAEAEPLCKRALAIREDTLGPQHPDVATSLNNLARLYRNQGLYENAEPLYRRAVAITEETLGSGHPALAKKLNGLGVVYRGQGRYAEAESLFKRALAIHENALGSDDPDIAFVLSDFALLYADQGRYSDAEPLHKRALAIREVALEPKHPDLVTSLKNYAALLREIGRTAEAGRLVARAETNCAMHAKENPAK